MAYLSRVMGLLLPCHRREFSVSFRGRSTTNGAHTYHLVPEVVHLASFFPRSASHCIVFHCTDTTHPSLARAADADTQTHTKTTGNRTNDAYRRGNLLHTLPGHRDVHLHSPKLIPSHPIPPSACLMAWFLSSSGARVSASPLSGPSNSEPRLPA